MSMYIRKQGIFLVGPVVGNAKKTGTNKNVGDQFQAA